MRARALSATFVVALLGAWSLFLAPSKAASPYSVPDPLPPGAPGDVITAESLGPVAGMAGSASWRVLYHSRAIDDRDIAVSGAIFRPAGKAPVGGFPVVAWAHGTKGTGDRCAPSRSDPAVPFLAAALAAGYVVVATDYEGLGTPGPHPYLIGDSEGRSVLDAVRAARRLDGVAAGDTVVVWGHSQGGHAALFAGALAAEYAPELQVLGVVAIAPAADLSVVGRTSLGRSFGVLLLGTWSERYPALDLARLLTPEARELVPLLEDLCLPQIAAAVRRLPRGALATASPLDDAPLADLLAANSVPVRREQGPILLVHGELDAAIPVAASTAFAADLREVGVDVELRTYPGADHSGVLVAAAPDVLAWTADRFAEGLQSRSSVTAT